MEKYLEELNESQQKAVVYLDGPALVIAGAGSGKTRVLTYKIAWLLKQGFAPHRILALTFTNKAAREMKERIAGIVGEETARRLWMGTFHSIFSRILRREAERLGFTSNFTIYDATDSKNLIKSIIKEMQLDDKVYRPGMIQSRISNAKNALITYKAYEQNKQLIEDDLRNKIPLVRDIYARYQNRCQQAGAMDFDDLLLQTNLLFRDHPDVLETILAINNGEKDLQAIAEQAPDLADALAGKDLVTPFFDLVPINGGIQTEDGKYLVTLEVTALTSSMTEIGLLHYSTVRNLWEIVEPTEVNYDEKLITAEFEDFSPVAVIAKINTDTAARTGDTSGSMMSWYLGLAVVAAALIIGCAAWRKTKTK